MKREKVFFIISNLLISFILGLVFSNLAIVVVNSMCLVMLLVLFRDFDSKIYKHITIIYIINIAAMLLLYYGYILKYNSPYYLGGSDDRNFELWAEEAIKSANYTISDVNQNKLFEYYNCNGFIWFVSMLMRFSGLFGGYHTIILRMLNIYLLIYIGALACKYFIKYENSEKYRMLLYMITLFPNAVYISIHGFRDTLFAFIIFSVFYVLCNIKEYTFLKKILVTLYTLAATYLAYNIRAVGIIYILVIVILNFILNNKENNKVKTIIMLIMFVTLCIVFMASFGIFEEIQKYLGRYNEYILEGNDGLSSFVFSLPIFPLGIILRIIYGLMFPSPTGLFIERLDIDGICKFLLALGTIIQIYLLPYIVKNIRKIDKILIIYILIFASIILTTFGFRHFIILYPFMFILILRQYIKMSKEKKNKMFFMMTFFALIGASIYLMYQII